MPRGRPKGSGVAAAGSSALERMVYEIGQRLGQALVAGVKAAAPRGKTASPGKRGPGRPRAAAGPSCVVPDCGRRGVARGLCATHYRKARRLGFGESLSGSQLDELSQDGRKRNKAA
jgi:hypothetical protein